MSRPRRRRPARLALVCLALVAVGVSAAGCGDGERFAEQIGGGDSATTVPQTPMTPVQAARRAAQAVNLRETDFPYLPEREANTRSSNDRKSQREFESCVGETSLESDLASVDSPEFSGTIAEEFLQFSSSAEVFRSATAAARISALLRSPKVFHCLTRLLQPALENEETGEVEVVSVRTARLPSPASDIAGVVGFRVTATVAPAAETKQLTAYAPTATPDGRPTLNVYLDLLSFVSDRIEVSMTATGGPRPVPHSLEGNLLRLLEGRAQEEAEGLP